ncbi:MAG TPA: sigma-70 family RNA polymerase sigma factor [Phycisphaerae bacterium]|nr:sigma-70 family RNA polymerase sigma factor [Phycisphaerae bacterium]
MSRSVVTHFPEPTALWSRYLALRNVEDRNALVTHYAGLATAEAARMCRRLTNRVTFDEIRCAALDGLLRAVETYDPARSTPFASYCRRRMKGSVLDWLRSQDPQGRSVRRFIRRRDQFRSEFGALEGREPADAELAVRMGLSAQRFARLAERARLGAAVPFAALDHQLAGGAGGTAMRWDIPDRHSAGPEARAARVLLTECLTRGLSHEEKLVLVLYYHENLTMAEVGAVLKLSESRISQIHADVLRRLRQRFGDRLREELSC